MDTHPMGVSPRLLSLVGGLAVALGLGVLAGPAVAYADDGTGEPAPGPSSAGPASDDAVAPPLKAPPQMPTMDVGNGRVPGTKDPLPSKTSSGSGRNLGQFDGGGGSGIGDVSSGAYGASSQQAEAEEAEEMAEMLSTQKDLETEFMTEMQDFAEQVNSLAGTVADNSSQRRSQYPG
jgi:hypothetical protein